MSLLFFIIISRKIAKKKNKFLFLKKYKMSENGSPSKSESKTEMENENEFSNPKMLVSQKLKDYEDLKTEYEA